MIKKLLFSFAVIVFAITLAPSLALAVAPTTLVARFTGSLASVGTNSLTINGVTVNISTTTVLLRRFGAKATLAEMSPGDQVMVTGLYTDANKTAVSAKVVRDLSIQKRRGTFVGTVQTLTTTGFTLQTLNRGIQTVTVAATTKYFDRQEKAITLANVLVGHRISVFGLWDNKLNTVSEVVRVKDYSLPSIPAQTPQTLPIK